MHGRVIFSILASVRRLAADRNRVVCSCQWLCLLGASWGGLVILAHETTPLAIRWTHRLFGWLILLTYIASWGWAIGLASRTRLMLFRAIVCTLTLAMILGCLELSAGLRLVHWSLSMQQLTGDGHRYTWAYQLDNALEFRRIPNDHWRERAQSDIERGWNIPPSHREPLVFTYDRWGYRNPISLEQADVALIGDSYVEGWYVSDEQTLARHLQAHLGRPVVNLGVAGFCTGHFYKSF